MPTMNWIWWTTSLWYRTTSSRK